MDRTEKAIFATMLALAMFLQCFFSSLAVLAWLGGEYATVAVYCACVAWMVGGVVRLFLRLMGHAYPDRTRD